MNSDDTTVSAFLAAMGRAALPDPWQMTAAEIQIELLEIRAELTDALADPNSTADRAELVSVLADCDRIIGHGPATAVDPSL